MKFRKKGIFEKIRINLVYSIIKLEDLSLLRIFKKATIWTIQDYFSYVTPCWFFSIQF